VKVVLDTNVLLAAFATHGLCDAVFEACLASHRIVLSEHILKELRRHLLAKIRMPSGEAEAVLRLLEEQAEIVRPVKVPPDACRDRSDLAVLGTALAARADCIVTGDHDLLDLDAFRGIPILSPRAFHDRL
jgi:uncharacterized protein